MNDPYIPIACSLHDQYEIAIMHKQRLDIRWSDEFDVLHTASVLPRDILVREGQEFLIADGPDGATLRIRLDKIALSGS